MRNKIKTRVIILIAAIFLLSSSISYATDMTSTPQINTRGLVFNTGIASDQIRLLKDFFRSRGDKDVPWGYSYDARTKELVRNYQREKGLMVDGIAGKSTIDRINQDLREKDYNVGLRIPYTDVKGEMIIINKSSNTLYFLKDGKIQNSYPVATGKSTELTPSGKFKIVIKFKNPRWGGAGISDPIEGGAPDNPLGSRWIGISYGGGGKYGVHGNSNPRSIGTYASLGCVRMFNSDVEELYEKVKMNIPIWMGPESALESYGVKFKSNYVPKPKPPKPPKPETPKPPKPAPAPINLRLNGQQLNLQNPVINREGTTYHPFREILEHINATVIWDDANKKAIGILGERYVEFQLDNNQYVDSDGFKYLPNGQKVFSNEGRVYIPIRNLMESLGYNVSWEQATSTVVIEDEIVENPSEDQTVEDELQDPTIINDPIEDESPQEGIIEEESPIEGEM